MSPEFRFDFIEIDDIEGTARQASDGWFDLELGIAVGERSVRLEPLLADLFQRDRRWLAGAIDSILTTKASNSRPISASGCGCGRTGSSRWCAC